MVYTSFKNEQRENPKKILNMKVKGERPRGDQNQDGNNRL